MHCQTMAEEHRHPHRRRVDREARQIEHAAALLPQAPLLAGCAIRLQSIHLRNYIEGDLAAKRPSTRLLAAQHGHGLCGEFVHGPPPAARYGMIARDLRALEAGERMERG